MERKFYVICTTPRSGSNLLCDLLKSSGVMGKPSEIFNLKGAILPFAKQHGLVDSNSQISLEQYLNRRIHQFSSDNGVFGFKIFYRQLEPLLDSNYFKQFIQNCQFIWLQRQDIIAQAVSLYIAQETGNWKSTKSQDNLNLYVKYDQEKIDHCLKNIIRQNLGWRDFFYLNKINYFPIIYENILSHTDEVCQEICKFSQVETNYHFSIEIAKLEKQGKSLNSQFAERFRQNSSWKLNTPSKSEIITLKSISIFELTQNQNQLKNQINSQLEEEVDQDQQAQNYLELGKLKMEKGLLDEAKAFYLKVIDLQPNFYEAYLQLGDVLKKQGQLDEAIQYYIDSTQVKPKPSLESSYIKLNWILKDKGVLRHHIDKIHHFILNQFQEKPHYVQIQNLLINCLVALGKNHEVSQLCQDITYRKNLASKPKFVEKFWETGKLGKPNFMIIGFMKCGTTSLYNYMTQHPNILPASKKELNFFNDEQLFKLGLDWYGSNFPPIPDGSGYLTGEASILYILDSIVAQRVWRTFPDTKFIVMLRNPVDRAFSHYYFNLQNQGFTKNIELLINRQIEILNKMQNPSDEIDVKQQKIIDVGLYVYFLQKWMTLFPKEQFLILCLENLAKDSQVTVNQVFDFLELPSHSIETTKIINQGSYKSVNEGIRNQLSEFFKPYNEQLENYLGMKFNWK